MELTNEFRVNVPIARAWTVLTDIERIAPCLPGAQLEEIEGDEFRGNVKIKVGPITAQYKGKATFVERDDVNHRAVLRGEGRDTKGQGNASAMITAQLTSEGDSSTKVRVVTDLTITGRVAQFGRGVLADVSAKLLGQFVQCLEHDVLVKPEETLSAVASASAGAAVGTSAAAVFPPPPPPPPVGAAEGGATRVADATLVDPVSAVPTSLAAPTDAVPAIAVAETTSTASASAATDGSAAATTAPVESATVTTPAAPAAPQVRKIAYQPSQPVDLLDAAGTPVLKRVAPIGVLVLLVLWLLRRRRG